MRAVQNSAQTNCFPQGDARYFGTRRFDLSEIENGMVKRVHMLTARRY